MHKIKTNGKVVFLNLVFDDKGNILDDWFLSEDLLQIEYKNHVLDLWWYNHSWLFKFIWIKKYNRDNPILQIESKKISLSYIQFIIENFESKL
jgi:hypothetical protein